MNQLQQFMYGNQEMRTVNVEGEPWFVAKDVCSVLDIDPSQSRRLDEDEKGLRLIQTLGGEQEMLTVNESGLYSLIIGSRKPEAKQFKRWITHEVIPSIRKHGAYMTPATIEKAILSPDFIIQLANQIKTEQEKNQQLQTKIEQDKPKTLFADAVATSNDSILIGQLATILKQNGVNIGQTRLFNFLREEGYLCKSGDRRNLPTQKAMDLRLFEIKEFTVVGNTGSRVKSTPKVTGQGQIYFINKFLKAS